MNLQHKCWAVGAGILLAIGLAACGGGASTGSASSSGNASAGDPQTASCAGAMAGSSSAMAFHPSAKMHGLTLTPKSVSAPVNVIQTVPAPGTVGADYQNPMVLFFDGMVDPNSAANVTVMGSQSSTINNFTVSHSCTPAGKSMLAIQPGQGAYLPGEAITVDWTGVMGTNGYPVEPKPSSLQSGLASTAGSQFHVVDASLADFSGSDLSNTSKDFDDSDDNDDGHNKDKGMVCTGDCIMLSSAFGDAPAIVSGASTKSAFLSTGTSAGSGKNAIGNTTSSLTLHNMENAGGKLTFQYRFISSELPHWYVAGHIFDDVFMVSLSGPKGTVVKTITSVNRLGDDDQLALAQPGTTKPKFLTSIGEQFMHLGHLTPGTFDATGSVNNTDLNGGGYGTMMTGVLTGEIDAATVAQVADPGQKMTVVFYVSDVYDAVVDSLVQLNGIKSNHP